MMTRHFDHIDLRVRTWKWQKDFTGNCCPSWDLCTRARAKISTRFILRATGRRSFLVIRKTEIISRMERALLFGRRHAPKSIGLRDSSAKSAARIWKDRKSVSITVRATTHFSSKILTATNWKFAAGKVRSLRNERTSAKSWVMSDPAHVPAIVQGPRRVRYLKLIALFKIGKGVLLLLLGISLLFLNARTRWMDLLSNWTDEEILLGHSKAVHFLLSKLQDMLAGGGALRATGFLALFYCAVLFTEGIGVYFQKRWA